MNRALAIAVLVSAPLLAQPVAAQDCLCGAGAWTVSPVFGMQAFGMQAFGMEAFDPPAETRDTTIVSVLVVAPRAERAPAAPAVLWCTGGNDPRCMPMQPTDAPAFQALSAGPVAVTVDPSRPELARIARELNAITPAEGLAPAHGVVRSIERPPRG